MKFAVTDDGFIWRLIVSALFWLGSNLLGLMSARSGGIIRVFCLCLRFVLEVCIEWGL